ncbi:hypothetical protein B0J13DRAFT_626526 [Dactylonectria estremocensis]|uniref:Fungal N-terminal domain-containing protein n=1 Tax=Dactylonectria estremocensis TaxID=1079267 RepID=A0A9P9E6G2_9HYPO|nr:hypothetical protein B0J13DRAFT_626526 [Dactylonectria estremocensis]
MAEIPRIVTGVITVVETVGKLGSSAIKLKQLWDEVQDVLESIKRVVTELEGLVEDMQLQVASANKGKRTIAKFRVAIKKDALEQFHKRLGSALQLLSIAQQTYLIALTRARHSIMLSEFQALQDQPRKADVPRVVSVAEETDTDDTTSIKRKSTFHGGLKAWDFCARRAYDGWKIQLTPWCTRSFDSEVFEYAAGGMTNELLAAIEAK